MRYRVKSPLTGAINAKPWPEIGGVIDLPAATGDEMVAAGHLERIEDDRPRTEKRPAPKRAETRER